MIISTFVALLNVAIAISSVVYIYYVQDNSILYLNSTILYFISTIITAGTVLLLFTIKKWFAINFLMDFTVTLGMVASIWTYFTSILVNNYMFYDGYDVWRETPIITLLYWSDDIKSFTQHTVKGLSSESIVYSAYKAKYMLAGSYYNLRYDRYVIVPGENKCQVVPGNSVHTLTSEYYVVVSILLVANFILLITWYVTKYCSNKQYQPIPKTSQLNIQMRVLIRCIAIINIIVSIITFYYILKAYYKEYLVLYSPYTWFLIASLVITLVTSYISMINLSKYTRIFMIFAITISIWSILTSYLTYYYGTINENHLPYDISYKPPDIASGAKYRKIPHYKTGSSSIVANDIFCEYREYYNAFFENYIILSSVLCIMNIKLIAIPIYITIKN